MDLDANLREYLNGGITPDERDASFDYCFNYFQSFRESDNISALASPTNVQVSCLQLGFYLASWGMLRGSAELLQRSARYLVPIIEVVAQTEMSLWELDAHLYNESNINFLLELAGRIRQARPGMSDILLTKTCSEYSAVFLPSMETLRRVAKLRGSARRLISEPWRQIGDFYRNNAAVIDSYRVPPTLDFVSGQPTRRSYTRAKVIDMAFYNEGEARAPA